MSIVSLMVFRFEIHQKVSISSSGLPVSRPLDFAIYCIFSISIASSICLMSSTVWLIFSLTIRILIKSIFNSCDVFCICSVFTESDFNNSVLFYVLLHVAVVLALISHSKQFLFLIVFCYFLTSTILNHSKVPTTIANITTTFKCKFISIVHTHCLLVISCMQCTLKSHYKQICTHFRKHITSFP